MTRPTTYKKLIATRYSLNFRDVAEMVETEWADPAPNEVVIRNHYAGVNASDVNMSAGFYTPKKQPPIDLGAEAIGEIVAVGAEVTDHKVGDQVMSFAVGSGFREYAPVRTRFIVPMPEVSPEVMTLGLSGVTASIGLHVTGEMQSGQTVLVTAAAGGTGQFAVQLAKLAGCHVIGTCGSDDKADLLKSLGCDRVMNYQRENVGEVLKAEYGRGIDLIYESVGRAMFDTCVDNLATHGKLVIIGYISEYIAGAEAVTAPRIYVKLLAKSASLRGMFLPHFIQHLPEHLIRLSELYREGKLHVAIDDTPFVGVESVVDAVEYLHSGKSRGKVVVRLNHA
jgi:NADPH-dependent curcumin reductase CurA